MSMALPIPEMTTGGCLCGGVRFQINFAPDHDWKRGPHTCQCTQCRKNSGCLIYSFHTVKLSELTWHSRSTYSEYNSSPRACRAFCKNCGSPLGWIDRENATEIELAVGCFDEEFLIGGRDGEDRSLGASGLALANPEGDHFHVRNEIKGVTDEISVKGTRFWKGSKEGPISKDKPTH
ncbi:Mss4-like protein [Mycena sp. CBHHK59/15]|nr:Mss4-like protein [Mycena sp. CBHHK59/15]